MGIAKGPQILSLFFVVLAPVSSVWPQQSDARKSIARKSETFRAVFEVGQVDAATASNDLLE